MFLTVKAQRTIGRASVAMTAAALLLLQVVFVGLAAGSAIGGTDGALFGVTCASQQVVHMDGAPLRRRPRTSMVFVASCMTALWRSQSSGMFSALFSRIRKQPRSHRPDIALTPFVSRPSLRRCRHARRLPSLSDLVFGGRCLAMTFVPERFAGGLEPLNNAAQGLQNKDGGLSRDIRGVIAGLRSRLSHDRSETTPSQTKPRS